MKPARSQFHCIALNILAWRALDRMVPGAAMFAIPGLHSSMPFQEPPEYPSCPGGPHDVVSAQAGHFMGIAGHGHHIAGHGHHFASHGHHFAGHGQHRPRPQPVEYRVGFRFTNIGASPFRFDELMVEISSSTGIGRAYRRICTPGGENSPKPPVILPGDTWDYMMGTNGYTGDLIRDSCGRPLRIDLAMLRRERITGGPWHTQLPQLPDLPRIDQDHFAFEETIPQGARRLHVPSLTDN